MSESYTLGAQYQLGGAGVAEVRYVGNHMFRQFQSLNTNPDILHRAGLLPRLRRRAGALRRCHRKWIRAVELRLSLLDTVSNTAFSIYKGLQTSFTARNFHHWTGTVSYTYSRTIDNTSEIYATGSGGNTSNFAQDPLNPDGASVGSAATRIPVSSAADGLLRSRGSTIKWHAGEDARGIFVQCVLQL